MTSALVGLRGDFMAINQLIINNFLLFNGNDESPSFNETFNQGFNVFVGANGTGKSTLLKCIYMACEFSRNKENDILPERYFSSNKSFSYNEPGSYKLISRGSEFFCEFDYGFGMGGFGIGLFGGYGGTPVDKDDPWRTLNINSIMIPSSEMLSHSPGFLALNHKYKIPFDQTQIDILANAQLPEAREIDENTRNILESLSDIIEGDVIYENDVFYLVKRNGLKIEFSLEAEGFRRLGLLWKLIRNGLFTKGTVFLWDEPESGLNPELMPILVETLYKLQRNGVQIFIATHNYLLAKYIELLSTNPNSLIFISLCRDKKQSIKATHSDTYANINNNPIEAAEEKLYNAILQKAMDNKYV